MNIYAMTYRLNGPFGVYHCYDESSNLLYVGRSNNVSRRMKAHRSQSGWFNRCASVGIIYCDSLDEAKELEDKSILELFPEFNQATNKTGPWCRQKIGPMLPSAVEIEHRTRIPVPLSDHDKEILKAAAKRHGISTLGDYLRFAGLYVAQASQPVRITRSDEAGT